MKTNTGVMIRSVKLGVKASIARQVAAYKMLVSNYSALVIYVGNAGPCKETAGRVLDLVHWHLGVDRKEASDVGRWCP